MTVFVSDQETGTACNGCGACCDPVVSSVNPETLDEEIRLTGVLSGEGDAVKSLLFIRDHWTFLRREGEERLYSCDAFDPETRLCTAHEARPPICRGYPWYGRRREHLGPLSALMLRRYLGCEFWADLSPEIRPEGWAPVLLTTKPKEA